jgi:ribosomal protein S18 acetylase RimI-like enzyme
MFIQTLKTKAGTYYYYLVYRNGPKLVRKRISAASAVHRAARYGETFKLKNPTDMTEALKNLGPDLGYNHREEKITRQTTEKTKAKAKAKRTATKKQKGIIKTKSKTNKNTRAKTKTMTKTTTKTATTPTSTGSNKTGSNKTNQLKKRNNPKPKTPLDNKSTKTLSRKTKTQLTNKTKSAKLPVNKMFHLLKPAVVAANMPVFQKLYNHCFPGAISERFMLSSMVFVHGSSAKDASIWDAMIAVETNFDQGTKMQHSLSFTDLVAAAKNYPESFIRYYIANVCTATDKRGQGIASSLLNFAIETVRKSHKIKYAQVPHALNHSIFALEVWTDNVGAQRIYTKAGFKKTKEFEENYEGKMRGVSEMVLGL